MKVIKWRSSYVDALLPNLGKVDFYKISYIELVKLILEKNQELYGYSISLNDACCLAKCLKYKRE